MIMRKNKSEKAFLAGLKTPLGQKGGPTNAKPQILLERRKGKLGPGVPVGYILMAHKEKKVGRKKVLAVGSKGRETGIILFRTLDKRTLRKNQKTKILVDRESKGAK